MTIPIPMPVPTETKTKFATPLPTPCACSPSAARLMSFSTASEVPSRSWSESSTPGPLHPERFEASRIAPLRSSTTPGLPITVYVTSS